MPYDLLIKDAQICDGTGAPIYSGSLAVEDGKIAALGDISGIARRELNAGGSVLAPGFIDIHTHYDAQVSWGAGACARTVDDGVGPRQCRSPAP